MFFSELIHAVLTEMDHIAQIVWYNYSYNLNLAIKS